MGAELKSRAEIQYAAFIKALKQELAAPGRSQSALARALNLNASAINRLVNGKRELRLRELADIQNYLLETGPVSSETIGYAELLASRLRADSLAERGITEASPETGVAPLSDSMPFRRATKALQMAAFDAIAKASPLPRKKLGATLLAGEHPGEILGTLGQAGFLLGVWPATIREDLTAIGELADLSELHPRDAHLTDSRLGSAFMTLLQRYAAPLLWPEVEASPRMQLALFNFIAAGLSLRLTLNDPNLFETQTMQLVEQLGEDSAT